jgi:putative spermidine/putrescine transport system substrate-binding protein
MSRTRLASLAVGFAAAFLSLAVPTLGQGASNAPASAAPLDIDALIAAAEAEGALGLIAPPRTFCGYGDVIDSFKAKYDLIVTEIDSDDELESIRTSIDNPGPGAPDVVDILLSSGPSAAAEGLLAPYKASTWESIPVGVKDEEGFWYGNYFGVLTFETNTAFVASPPTDWSDLLRPEHRGQVALPGDPRVSNQPFQVVFASALANGGSLDDATLGLEFWRQVNEAGNFVPIIARDASIDDGATPITIRWSYRSVAHRHAVSGTLPIDVRLPSSGPWAGMFIDAISAYAPHPNAARLWIEYLYSDEGQNGFLKGNCYPIRYDDLKARGVLDSGAAARLPDPTGATFPTLDQLVAASDLISQGWDAIVGVVPQ